MPIVAGVDEAGRGPLAGPVVAAAVILPDVFDLPELTDSKLLSEAKREQLFERIKVQSVAWAIGRADVAEIDQINILQATMVAMRRAVEGLSVAPEWVLIDGNRCPEGLNCPARAIVQGDKTEAAISAASILAKVTRDREMLALDALYPGYDLAKHKGYGTKAHRAAIKRLGVLPIHRQSFRLLAD